MEIPVVIEPVAGTGCQAPDNPWLAMAGMHDPNHPLVQEWKAAIDEYRRQRDRDDAELPRAVGDGGGETMEIQVLIERVGDDRYKASAFALSAEGATMDRAVQSLREIIEQRLARGGTITHLKVPGTHPVMKWAGTWRPDDPEIDEYLRHVEAFRKQMDEEADRP